jgi:hypothetical protein
MLQGGAPPARTLCDGRFAMQHSLGSGSSGEALLCTDRGGGEVVIKQVNLA